MANLPVRDGNGDSKFLKATESPAGVFSTHHRIDAVPADPFGAIADAADATGSMMAKLRAIATLVNLISGQSGLAGGAGAVAANTPRVTLASDDPLLARVGAVGAAADSDGVLLGILRYIAESGIPVLTVAAATLANVASSATSVTLFAANASARGRTVFNDSTQPLYLKFGATASATSFTVKIAAGGYYEFPAPFYRGIVDGLWDSANGSARTTEW